MAVEVEAEIKVSALALLCFNAREGCDMWMPSDAAMCFACEGVSGGRMPGV